MQNLKKRLKLKREPTQEDVQKERERKRERLQIHRRNAAYLDAVRMPKSLKPELSSSQILKLITEAGKLKAVAEHWDKPFSAEVYGGILPLLCLYLAKDPRFEELGRSAGLNFSLSKGLLLTGPVGCGKTRLMEILGNLQLGDRNFAVEPFNVFSVRDVVERFKSSKGGGEEGITVFTRPAPNAYRSQYWHDAIGWCFDDLGTEGEGHHFSDRQNVMQGLLEKIYSKCVGQYFRFHATTNGSLEDLKKAYGGRFADRLGEMFNWIEFEASSPSLRPSVTMSDEN
ncbi:P-loop NTPase family protein [Siphonobacter curvatus]|nr:hypothetical protein [Siphonobacter curvatus]